ncbi:hypothetical protein KOF112_30100 [Bacillus velezensis]|nr:hypothetical protein KOF112_30100 [Bacillus velezensis]
MIRLRYLFEESPVYIPFQELNFMFYDSEIRRFRELWAANESYLNIAKEQNGMKTKRYSLSSTKQKEIS